MKTRLELTWVGKEKRPRLEPRILLEDPEKSYHAKHRVTNDDIFDNRLIFGDNLLALKALEQEFAGKIKCIYIDPPYNTGSAFTHYDDGLEHSLWLSLMRDRLELLRRLLRPDGSLWISIDDAELAYLRVLMDEVFGRKSFIACNVWQKRYSRENREAIGDVHEYVLVYAVDADAFKATRNRVPLEAKSRAVYKNPNNDPRGPWRAIPMTAQGYRPNQMYPITTPTGVTHRPPEGRCWSTTEDNYKKLLAEGRIYFGKTNDSQPNIIRYLSEVEGHVPWTWWPHEEVGHTDEARKESQALFGKDSSFDTAKPERLMRRILEIASNPGDWVLDSFAGSGTTGAVAHKLGRRWILAELGNHCHTHIIPRLRQVIDGTDSGGISSAADWLGGGGFRYFRLAPSLLEKDSWGNWVVSKQYNAAMLAEAVCKLEGFTYSPSDTVYWQHGQSTERDFIYVTTQNLSRAQLEALSESVGDSRSLLVYCMAFRTKADSFPNLTIKKIPNAVLNRCEWGKDDYSLQVENLPAAPAMSAQPEPEPGPVTGSRSRSATNLSLFPPSGGEE